ncbi:RNF26 ligase, partial [Callaeas wilsoni]|nr:RNF26 ligase [Callaeas wilsoni]
MDVQPEPRRGLQLLRDLLRELLLLALDLNFLLCSWLVSALPWLLRAAAAACGDALALLRGCCAGTEGLPVLALRGRELAQRDRGAGLRCGKALGVGTGLLMHLGKVCLAGTRSLFTLLAALRDTLAGSVVGVSELLAAFLPHVSGRATAASIQLWQRCQLAFRLLCSATVAFTSIFFIGVYILELLLRIAFLIAFFSVIYCNQELLWVLKRQVLGCSRRLQPLLRQLCQVAVLPLHRAVTSQHWRRLADWILQVTDGSQAGRMMNQGRGQLDAGQVPQPRPALSCAGAGQRHQTLKEEPGTSGGRAARRQQLNAAAGNAEGTSGNNPWVLLKEQEERKKCVICQDQTKTVLLLPCRHLCLCQECTEVLLQQDVYQRNCPLCRQVILQTLNVYL